jgi:hypothetical protein
MVDLINRLNEIEQQHPEFFKEKGKSISDYIAGGMYIAGVFVNAELPQEIMDKVHKAFNRNYKANGD